MKGEHHLLQLLMNQSAEVWSYGEMAGCLPPDTNHHHPFEACEVSASEYNLSQVEQLLWNILFPSGMSGFNLLSFLIELGRPATRWEGAEETDAIEAGTVKVSKVVLLCARLHRDCS